MGWYFKGQDQFSCLAYSLDFRFCTGFYDIGPAASTLPESFISVSYTPKSGLAHGISCITYIDILHSPLGRYY